MLVFILNIYKTLIRTTKLKLYSISIRPVVTYSVESWAQGKDDEDALTLFERKISRLIFEDGK